MNQYLRAVGFSKIKSMKMLEKLYRDIRRNPDHRTISGRSLSLSGVQLDKTYGAGGIGLSIVGEMDSEGNFIQEYSFPYVTPGNYVFNEEVIIDERSYMNAYSGVIDNINLSVIFFVQNVAYVNGLIWNNRLPAVLRMALSGLSTSGSVLLPLKKTQQEREYDINMRMQERFTIQNVRRGDEEALDNMLNRDLQIKDALDQRIISEDILSIVDNSIIPYSTESDVFDLIGTILNVNEIENTYTSEHVYLMDVECIYYIIRIAINKEDLMGEPLPGRRFRGITWLQGSVCIE